MSLFFFLCSTKHKEKKRALFFFGPLLVSAPACFQACLLPSLPVSEPVCVCFWGCMFFRACLCFCVCLTVSVLFLLDKIYKKKFKLIPLAFFLSSPKILAFRASFQILFYFFKIESPRRCCLHAQSFYILSCFRSYFEFFRVFSSLFSLLRSFYRVPASFLAIYTFIQWTYENPAI